MERQERSEVPGFGSVKTWLFIGLILVAGQILIGGITRLTGSGLSITRWEIVTGTLPPLNEEQWTLAFDLYKETPQYRLINQGMALSDFKYIYFWEYFHRLWARSMGLIFVFPFLYFLWKRRLSRVLIRKLLLLVLLAAITASFGWIMVASGLLARPWVNAYKLGVHLLLGFSVFIWLFHIWYTYPGGARRASDLVPDDKVSGWFVFLIVLQIFMGGLVSGMKAGYAYPTWPLYNGHWVPSVLLESGYWNFHSFVDYDESGFMAAFVQFAHRNLAYVIALFALFYGWRIRKSGFLVSGVSMWSILMYGVVLIQVLLGIFTLLGFRSGMPVVLASLHQFTGLMLLTLIFHLWYHK
jgi:heme a synthase